MKIQTVYLLLMSFKSQEFFIVAKRCEVGLALELILIAVCKHLAFTCNCKQLEFDIYIGTRC